MLIGQKVRALRVSRGLTQKQLADGLYERSYISLIERCKIVPTIEAVSLIAPRLGISVEELIRDDQKIFETSMSIFRQGISESDTFKLKRAWDGFFQCRSLDNMISCVQKWASLASDSEVLAALKATLRHIEVTDREVNTKFELRILIGNCYFNMGMLKNAEWEFRAVLNDLPPQVYLPRIYLNLGSTLMELGTYKEAFLSLRNALKFDLKPRGKMRALLGLGRCYRYLGQQEQALACIQTVSDWAEGNDENLHNYSQHAIGVLLLDNGDVTGAVPLLTKVRNYYKDNQLPIHEAEVVEEFVRADVYLRMYESAGNWCDYGLSILKDLNRQLSGRFLLWKSQISKTVGKFETATNLELAAKIVLGDDFKVHQIYVKTFDSPNKR